MADEAVFEGVFTVGFGTVIATALPLEVITLTVWEVIEGLSQARSSQSHKGCVT